LLVHKVIQAEEAIVQQQAELLVVVAELANREQLLLVVPAQVRPMLLVLAELDTHGLILA
jgi:hypothetical protein